MLSQSIKALTSVFVLTLVSGSTLFGQDNLQQQFEEFYQKETSSWEEYKLIKQPKLKNFWSVVMDTLDHKESQIRSSRQTIASLNADLESIAVELASTKAALAESETLNDSISFVGIVMSKAAYNIMVWIIILALAVGVGVVYLMYMRSNAVTKKSVKAFAKLEVEFNDHKNSAREKQAKLKRELQTALNTLQENRINF